MRSPVVLVRLAERYAQYLSGPTPNAYLAWERFGQIIRALDPTQAFDLTCHLLRTLPPPYLPTFGGGAVAHLVDYHGTTLIDWIEREARRNVDFRIALSNAWVVGEGVHPSLLVRLRVAAGSRIHIARRAKRDAVYQAMFEGWVSGHPPRLVRHPRRTDGPKRLRHSKSVPSSAPPLTLPPLPPDAPWVTKLSVRLMTFHLNMSSKPRYLRDMACGAVAVWLPWFYMTTMSGRFILPVLLVVLLLVSASPAVDLVVVALAFVLTTVAAAFAGLVSGTITRRQRRFPTTPLYTSLMSAIPYLTLIGLIARAEHGVFAAPATIVALAARPYLWRFVRRAWTAGALHRTQGAVR